MRRRTALRPAALTVLGAGLLLGGASGRGPEPLSVSSHLEGAPAGHTGGAGEPSCHECHNDLELNEPEGRLDLVGFPGSYAPGRSYVVTVALVSEGIERAGFQAAVRGPSGRDAGTLASLGERTAVVADSVGRMYVGHTRGGSLPTTPDRTTWTFEWIAPAANVGAATLSVAANSANGDNSPIGDFIYTQQASAEPPR